jgi:hypothetical protein
MSFVLNRNVKEAKVIKYSGGEYTVSIDNKLKFINLKPISKSNLIEKNNLKKLYLINIGEKKNSNGEKIFLVGTTKKFNETAVMNVVEEEEEEEKVVSKEEEIQTMSNIYGKPNNNNRMTFENSPMRSRRNYYEESGLSQNQKSRLEKLRGQESPNQLMRERRITPEDESEEEEIETINKYYGTPNNNKMTYTNNPLYIKKSLPKSIVENKPIKKFEIGNNVTYTPILRNGKNGKKEIGKISGNPVRPSGRILYNFINNKGISKTGISINRLEKIE